MALLGSDRLVLKQDSQQGNGRVWLHVDKRLLSKTGDKLDSACGEVV